MKIVFNFFQILLIHFSFIENCNLGERRKMSEFTHEFFFFHPAFNLEIITDILTQLWVLRVYPYFGFPTSGLGI